MTGTLYQKRREEICLALMLEPEIFEQLASVLTTTPRRGAPPRPYFSTLTDAHLLQLDVVLFRNFSKFFEHIRKIRKKL
jgi:hypothetical protein